MLNLEEQSSYKSFHLHPPALQLHLKSSQFSILHYLTTKPLVNKETITHQKHRSGTWKIWSQKAYQLAHCKQVDGQVLFLKTYYTLLIKLNGKTNILIIYIYKNKASFYIASSTQLHQAFSFVKKLGLYLMTKKTNVIF